jgi:hypothetical protein
MKGRAFGECNDAVGRMCHFKRLCRPDFMNDGPSICQFVCNAVGLACHLRVVPVK